MQLLINRKLPLLRGENTMTHDEKQTQDLLRLKHALRAMSKSVNKALMMGNVDGTGDMMLKNYQRLHAKTIELFPDDFFIQSLEVELAPELDDKQKMSQVQLVTEQLATYVDSLLHDMRPSSFYDPIPDMEDIRNFGFNIRDQIVRLTRSTLKSTLANIDFDSDEGSEETEPKRNKRKVRINVDDDESEVV